jgi:hypothetical protein
MRVMVLVKATEESERGFVRSAWTEEMMAAMGRYNAELREAGILVAAEGLKPSSEGRRVVMEGDRRKVVVGPFEPAGELVAGYWLWEVRDLEEAMAWALRCPHPMPGGGVIEVRPLFGRSDLE